MKISDGVHFINAVTVDPRKGVQDGKSLKPLRQYDVIELSRFKLKQLPSKIHAKMLNYIAIREWPRFISEESEIIGEPKEFTEFRDDNNFSLAPKIDIQPNLQEDKQV